MKDSDVYCTVWYGDCIYVMIGYDWLFHGSLVEMKIHFSECVSECFQSVYCVSALPSKKASNMMIHDIVSAMGSHFKTMIHHVLAKPIFYPLLTL